MSRHFLLQFWLKYITAACEADKKWSQKTTYLQPSLTCSGFSQKKIKDKRLEFASPMCIANAC